MGRKSSFSIFPLRNLSDMVGTIKLLPELSLIASKFQIKMDSFQFQQNQNNGGFQPNMQNIQGFNSLPPFPQQVNNPPPPFQPIMSNPPFAPTMTTNGTHASAMVGLPSQVVTPTPQNGQAPLVMDDVSCHS